MIDLIIDSIPLYPDAVDLINQSISAVNTISGSLSSYSLTSHSHTQYATTASLSAYVSTIGNQSISGTKTFITLPQSSVSPSNNNDLVNKAYVDSVQAFSAIQTATTNDDQPSDLSISTLMDKEGVYVMQIIVIGFYSSDKAQYCIEKKDYIFYNNGTKTIIGLSPIYRFSNLADSIGHSIFDNGGDMVSSITGDSGNAMTWTVFSSKIYLT